MSKLHKELLHEENEKLKEEILKLKNAGRQLCDALDFYAGGLHYEAPTRDNNLLYNDVVDTGEVADAALSVYGNIFMGGDDE